MILYCRKLVLGVTRWASIILASFHNVGILLCVSEKLNMSMRALMACAPKCLRYKFEIPFRPHGG